MLKYAFLALLELCILTATLAAQCGQAVLEQNWNRFVFLPPLNEPYELYLSLLRNGI